MESTAGLQTANTQAAPASDAVPEWLMDVVKDLSSERRDQALDRHWRSTHTVSHQHTSGGCGPVCTFGES